MAIIYNYPLNSILLAEDMLIGTSTKIVNGQPKNATKNFSIADLTGFIKQNVSLDDVLLVGNTSLLDAKIGGLYLYDTPVADYGNIALNQNRFSFSTVTHGEVFRAQRDMFSSFSSSGYRGSFEVSNITANRVWDFPDQAGTVALLSDIPAVVIPTLQEVTDEGSTTTNSITIGGVTSGNFVSDGWQVGISDNYDGNYNFLYQPYSGLQVTNLSDYVYIYQDGSIGFSNYLLGGGNLRIDNVTSTQTWQFPNASGTLALTSNIPTVGTWGALNYPTWTTGTPFVKMTAAGTFALDTNTYLTTTAAASTYYPIPTGTISQYIRGDGTLATFPSVTVPTLQQVTNAGNTSTNAISITNPGLSPYYSALTLSFANFNNITTGKITKISVDDDLTFQNGANILYLKSPATISGTNTQTLQNASGTIALLSDIPTTSGIPHATATGTDTYTATVTGVTAYNDADAYLIRFTNGNTTSATLNINSLGAIPLYRNNDGVLIGGDIISGGEMLCVYNSATNRFQVIGTAPNSLLAYVTNDDSVTLTKGMPVYAFEGTGDRMTVKRANNTGDATSAQTVGLVLSTSIAANQKGLIMMQGLLDGLSILPTATWSDGDAVYLGATPGSITNIKPHAPNHLVYLGVVTTASNGSAGRMYVRVQNGYELDELHNVQAQTPSLNDTLWYDNTVSPAQWKTASIPTILGYTPVTDARTLTINGTSYDLTADRSWTITASGKSINTVSINTNAGSASSTDYVYLASGTINITLPTAVGNQNLYTIKNVGTGVITINTTSSQTIDGSLTAPIRVQYLSLTIISDGANWNII
jgi:hypothetical protein